MLPPSDLELVASARRGDADAFGVLVQRYQASVFNVCYRMAGERQEAEDLAQETFIRVYQRFNLYDAQRPFGPWIRRVAVNVCLNRLQRQAGPILELDDERDEVAAQAVTAPAASDPAMAHEQMENTQALRAALRELPPHYRAVIELRHFQDLSYAEISALLKLPLSDVKSHLFRARRLLADRLRSYA